MNNVTMEYRAELDQLRFTPEQKTALAERAAWGAVQRTAVRRRSLRPLAALAAAAAVLTLSVSAAVWLLSPAEVAEQMGQPVLAEAFRGEDAVLISRTETFGDYSATLLGFVSGQKLTRWTEQADESRTYAAVALERADGVPLERETFDPFAFTVSPVVDGYRPNAVNNWTLGAVAFCLVQDGRAYYLLDLKDLEMFAGHTVRLAVYEGGGAPSLTEFSMDENGALALRSGVSGALFSLPLDPEKADPAAVSAFLEGLDMPYGPVTDQDLARQADQPAPEGPASGAGRVFSSFYPDEQGNLIPGEN